jgi:hypothetical protein
VLVVKLCFMGTADSTFAWLLLFEIAHVAPGQHTEEVRTACTARAV